MFGVALSLCVASRSVAQTPPAAQPALAEAARYEQTRGFPAAADSYRAALKAAGGHCFECLDGLERVQMKLDLFKDAAATAAQMAKDAPDAAIKAQAEYREGDALFALYFAQTDGRGAIDKDPKKAAASLKSAEAVLQQGEADDPANEPLRMMHGRVLAAMKRDEDASREFAACAAAPGASEQECTRATHFRQDVSLARSEPAPHFALKTIDGKPVSLDSLSGKVVLIDFWATWCSVCARDSDYIQGLGESFDDKPFILLEVSADDELATVRNYVKDHRLGGTQTWDEGRAVADQFHVTGYPTYVVLDGDGTIRMRAVGIEGDLKGMVKKLLAAPPPDPRTPLPKPSQTGQ
jgi:thiol-disulfide isomerase/thioredoxin